MNVLSFPSTTVHLDDMLAPEAILERWLSTTGDMTLEEYAIAQLKYWMSMGWVWCNGVTYTWRDPMAQIALEIGLGLLQKESPSRT